MIAVILAVLLVAVTALFAVRAWLGGRFSLRDRLMILAETFGVVVAFAAASLLVDWTQASPALWGAAVVLTAAGTVGAARRFAVVPWRRTRRRGALRAVRLVLGGILGGGVVALAIVVAG
ncbi:MAG: hypothetical protein PIR02_05285 [Microbacterium enclense]